MDMPCLQLNNHTSAVNIHILQADILDQNMGSPLQRQLETVHQHRFMAAMPTQRVLKQPIQLRHSPKLQDSKKMERRLIAKDLHIQVTRFTQIQKHLAVPQ